MGINNLYPIQPSLDALNSYEQRSSLPIEDQIRLTVVIGDFSRSFAIESFESRFITGWSIAASVNNQAVFALNAKHLPLVVERVRFRTGDFFFLSEPGSENLLSSPTSAQVVSMGGKPSIGTAHYGYESDPFGAGLVFTKIKNTVSGDWISPENLRFYCPAGKWLYFWGSENVSIDFEFIVREVPGLPQSRS